MPAADALAAFLRALGVPGQEIHRRKTNGPGGTGACWRAGERALIVLDNAGSVEQVRPLLPGNPACAVVVTSRDSIWPDWSPGTAPPGWSWTCYRPPRQSACCGR